MIHKLSFKTRSMRLGFGLALMAMLAFSVLFNNNTAFAATKTWTGAGGDANWSTSSNWSPSGAPTNGDTLVFNLSSLGSQTSPNNDIDNISITGMTFSGGTQGQLFTLRFAQTTILNGTMTNSSNTRISLSGGFTLGSNVILTGGFSSGDLTGADNQIALAGHALTLSNYDGVTAITQTPITGTGTVNYTNLSVLQMNSVNTYSGTTNLTNVTSMYNTTAAPQSPSEMFGTSSIVVDASSRIQMEFSASATFNNAITLAATSVSGNSFNAQLFFESSQVSAAHEITLPNVVLTGSGGMSLSPGQIASVNLAGITQNGHCLYVPTLSGYQEKFLNVGSFCNASGVDFGDQDTDIPGVPNAGLQSRSNVAYLIAASVSAIALLAYVLKRNLLKR